MNDREKEMIKIEQGTSFDGERRRCVIASLTTADGGHDGVADDGNGKRAFAGRHFSLSTTGSKLIDNTVCEYFQHVSSLAGR